jgi:hypothetical protein
VKRRLVWVASAACVVVLAFGLTKRILGPPPGISRENCVRVRVGMTYAEVEALFGGPPQKAVDLLHEHPFFQDNPVPQLAGKQGRALLDWAGEHGRATVFVVNSRVQTARWLDWGPGERWTNAVVPPPRPNLLDRLRSWLGL